MNFYSYNYTLDIAMRIKKPTIFYLLANSNPLKLRLKM